MTSALKRTILAIGTLSLLASATTARAQEEGSLEKRPHTQIDRRLQKQNRRINHGVASGRLSPQEAQQLRANDSAIKVQEQAERQANGGYLTKGQRRQLNKEEDVNSKLIHDEKRGQ